MVMRISSIQAFNNGVSGLGRNYSNLIRTQEQISSGNRILTPADDPVASVRLLQLEQQQAILGQYKENLTAAKNSLTQEETTITSVVNVLQRIRELAVQAGGGALSADDRKSIAKELSEREGELLNLMNSRNARGEYLFSGFLGKTEPFLRNPDGTYSYQGDEGQRSLQVAGSSNVAINDNGKRLFEDVANANRIVNGLGVNNPALPTPLYLPQPFRRCRRLISGYLCRPAWCRTVRLLTVISAQASRIRWPSSAVLSFVSMTAPVLT